MFPLLTAVPKAEIITLVTWLDECAVWLGDEHAVAREHGLAMSDEAPAQMNLYQDAALLMREALS